MFWSSFAYLNTWFSLTSERGMATPLYDAIRPTIVFAALFTDAITKGLVVESCEKPEFEGPLAGISQQRRHYILGVQAPKATR